MCWLLHRFEGFKELFPIHSQAPGKSEAQSQTNDRAEGGVSVDFPSGRLEGLPIGFLEACTELLGNV
jgi:hypothetical protein